jgi:type II secretory pathway pseudopilin PulG
MTAMVKAAVVALALVAVALPGCKAEQKGIAEDMPAARATKARADAQVIAGAIRQYQATFGALPESIADLTEARTAGGVSGGPYLARVPAPPAGFTPYRYAKQGDVNFTVTSTAGTITVTAP